MAGLKSRLKKIFLRHNSSGSVLGAGRLNIIDSDSVVSTVAEDGTDEEIDITIKACGLQAIGNSSIEIGFPDNTQLISLFPEEEGQLTPDSYEFRHYQFTVPSNITASGFRAIDQRVIGCSTGGATIYTNSSSTVLTFDGYSFGTNTYEGMRPYYSPGLTADNHNFYFSIMMEWALKIGYLDPGVSSFVGGLRGSTPITIRPEFVFNAALPYTYEYQRFDCTGITATIGTTTIHQSVLPADHTFVPTFSVDEEFVPQTSPTAEDGTPLSIVLEADMTGAVTPDTAQFTYQLFPLAFGSTGNWLPVPVS